MPGLHTVDLGDGYDVAFASFANLGCLFPLDLEQGAEARMLSVVCLEVGSFGNPTPEDAGEGQAPDRTVDDLEHIERRVGHSEPVGRALWSRRLVPYGLQQPADTPGADCRTE